MIFDIFWVELLTSHRWPDSPVRLRTIFFKGFKKYNNIKTLPIVLFQKTERLRQCRFFVVFDPPPLRTLVLWENVFMNPLSPPIRLFSDSVTISYGESRDWSCEESWVPAPVKTKQGVILGPLCNQTDNLETDAKTLITVYWN